MLTGCGSATPLGQLFTDSAKPVKTTAEALKSLGGSIITKAVQQPPDTPGIIADAKQVQNKADDLADISDDIDKAQTQCMKLRNQLAAAHDESRQNERWIWVMFGVGGGLAIVAGAVLVSLGNSKLGATIIVGGVTAIALSILLPIIMVATEVLTVILKWVLIIGAVIGGGLLIWFAVTHRKNFEAIIDANPDTTFTNPDGKPKGAAP